MASLHALQLESWPATRSNAPLNARVRTPQGMAGGTGRQMRWGRWRRGVMCDSRTSICMWTCARKDGPVAARAVLVLFGLRWPWPLLSWLMGVAFSVGGHGRWAGGHPRSPYSCSPATRAHRAAQAAAASAGMGPQRSRDFTVNNTTKPFYVFSAFAGRPQCSGPSVAQTSQSSRQSIEALKP